MAASIEQKKQQYSKQLAAYTLRQWNAVRHESGSQRRERHQSSETRRDNNQTKDEGERNGQKTPTSRQNSNGHKGLCITWSKNLLVIDLNLN